MKIKLTLRLLFLVLGFSLAHEKLLCQIKPYVIFSGPGPGPDGTGTTLIGSSITINGVASTGVKGAVGGVKLVKTTGNATIEAHIHSWDKVSITNSNVIKGDIIAANSSAVPNPDLPPAMPGTAISIGSSLMLTGNIHSRGDIVISGGSVTGSVNVFPGTYFSSNPTPSILPIGNSPVIPLQPTLPDPKPDLLTNPAYNSTTNITTTLEGNVYPIDGVAGHGVYNKVIFTGNKTLKLNGPGIYVFDSISMTGNSNKIVFDFQNSPSGKFFVYIKKNADLGKVDAGYLGITLTGEAASREVASRVWIEVQGPGTGTTSPTASFLIANGAGGGSKILSTVYATRAAINIGSGTGSTSLTGALFSKTAVNIQSGVTINYEPFRYCEPPNVDAGPDKPLIITSPTTVTGSSTTPGVTFSWQALNGGIITSTSNTSSTSTITVSEEGTYVLTASTDLDCFSRDTVVVKNGIGADLKSIYLNNAVNSPFFIITPDGYIMIDVIVFGNYGTVLDLLTTPPYGLRNIQSNGESQFIITGEFPIVNLPKLNLVQDINFCRAYTEGINQSGVVTSAGDTSVRAWLVRNGYNLDGDGIKVGALSNSFSTITTATLAPFKTNTAGQDVANGDLPGPGNINGYTKPVVVLDDLPGKHSDEGRAMLQIVHDLAPAAELYFHTGSRTAGAFAKGIKDLHNAGCRVIFDDLTHIYEQFLTDGVVAQAVNEVTAAGTTYISACGNFASKSYEHAYVSAPAPVGFTGTAHNFASAGEPTDIYQSVTFQPGKYIIVLQWVDDNYSIGQGGTKNDLDIFTTPNTNGTNLFGDNRINTNGDAIEVMTFTVTSPTTTNILIVNKTAGSIPAWLKFVVFRGEITFNEYATGTSTIVGQANATGAIAIGAAAYFKAFPFVEPQDAEIESFSSTGGTTVFTKVGNSVVPEIRQKPELVAADRVNTTVKLGNRDDDGDLYFNFAGTSAAAPHAAAVAALIMQGNKKFKLQNLTTPSEIRSLLTGTATDMYATGFDFKSGYGFINADAAMRTIANPKPSIEELIVPPNPIANVTTFKVKGFNLSSNSKIYYGNTELTTTVLNNNEATALMPVLTGNQPIRVHTPFKSVSQLDGGFSNSLYFFSKQVTVIAGNATRKYAEVTTLTPTVLVDGVLLENTNPKLTLRDLGLNNLTLKVPDKAINPGNIGTYTLSFSQTSPDDPTLYQQYNYEFIEGTLTIQKLPVTITVPNMTVNLGQKIPNPTFTYLFDGTNIPDPDAFLNNLSSAHQSQLVKDVLGLVNAEAVVIENGEAVVIENGEAVVFENGQWFTLEGGVKDSIVNAQSLTIANGVVTNTTDYILSSSDMQNLSFLATTKSLQNIRVVNSNTVVDITQESILDFNKNAAQTTMLNSVSSVDAKGLVDVSSYTNGEAVVIENGEAVVIENGEAVVIENGEAVVIENGEAVVIENATVIIENGEAVVIDNATGEHIPLRFSNNRTAVIVNVNEIGRGLSLLKSLNIITGLTIGNHPLFPGALSNNNLDITYIAGIVSIVDPCPLLTRKPFTNFGSTTQKETSLWVNVTTKVSRQLAHGERLLFTSGSITFNNITAYEWGTQNTPITTKSLPDGMIVADASVSVPKTSYDLDQKIWITKIPVPFSSTSDIFISGGIIKSNAKGFKKLNGATTVVQGKFFSSTCTPFTDQWTYGIAAYQPIFDYPDVDNEGLIASINGSINGINYRAGTPIPFVNPASPIKLVNGGSGGGGNNYTGSTSSYETYTACAFNPLPAACSSAVTRTSSLNQEEIRLLPSAGEVQIMPNPATNYIMLSFVPGRTGNSKLVLYTVDGRKAFETNFGNTEATVKYQKTVDVSKLVNGIYLLQLWNEGKVTTSKIMISR